MKTIAVLLENMFDEQELIYPYHRLREDYNVHLVSPEIKTYVSKEGYTLESTHSIEDIDPKDYDGIFIPGGFSPDYMRRSPELINFVKEVDKADKPIAAICHGGWMLISSVDLKGVKATSFSAIKDDMVNAGADWVDEETVVDGNIITGRTPLDLPSLVVTFVEEIEKR